MPNDRASRCPTLLAMSRVGNAAVCDAWQSHNGAPCPRTARCRAVNNGVGHGSSSISTARYVTRSMVGVAVSMPRQLEGGVTR